MQVGQYGSCELGAQPTANAAAIPGSCSLCALCILPRYLRYIPAYMPSGVPNRSNDRKSIARRLTCAYKTVAKAQLIHHNHSIIAQPCLQMYIRTTTRWCVLIVLRSRKVAAAAV